MIRAVIADDHAIVRQGLRALLEGTGDYSVVGEASDGLTAIDLIVRLRPDVAILDIQIPDLNGLEVARRTLEQSSDTRVIVLSMHADETFVLEALRCGVAAYVLKGSATDDLLEATQAALAGRRFLSAPLAERALDIYAKHAGSSRPPDRYDFLTAREREVLQLAVQGLSTAEIGERLSISPRTVETHRANLMRKLGIPTHTDLVRFAVGRGLIPPIR